MPKRQGPSRSTPRRASTTASVARPPGTPSPSCAISRAATSSKPWSASPPRAGIAIRHDAGGKDQPDREGRKALLGVMERAVAFYHEELLSQPDAKRARQYLRSRGYQGEIVRQFGLGWAPETGRSLVGAVRAPVDLLVKAGLAHQGQNGLRDAFRGRVIFPIFDPAGKAIGLGGRILPGAGESAGPKYRNSPETPIYSKRRTLYGLNWAKHSIVQTGEVIICEGYTDVIGFFTAGLPWRWQPAARRSPRNISVSSGDSRNGSCSRSMPTPPVSPPPPASMNGKNATNWK